MKITQYVIVLLLAMSPLRAAAISNVDLNLSSDPPVSDIYVYSNNAPGNTWTIDGAITVGDGVGPDSRLFLGLNSSGFGGFGDGTLNLVGANGSGDSLLFNGSHPLDPILGRFGHHPGTPWAGILNIDGGLDVIWGGRPLRFSGLNVHHEVNVLDGTLDYTMPGFGFESLNGAGTTALNHTVGAKGAIILPVLISDTSGFEEWGDGIGADDQEILIEAASGLSLLFTQDTQQGTTTITAVPEPGFLVLLGLGGIALVGLRQMRASL